MSLEKEIKEFKIILKNTKKESNPNPFEQRLLRKVIKLIQELQTAKEENEKLRNLLGKPYKRRIDLENNKLTQQNKQMREALEKAKKMFIEQGHCPWADGTGKFDCESCNDNCMFPSIQQALNQLKGVE